MFLFGYEMSRFSKMPEPPYYAVIFANQASKTPEGYAEMAAAMGEIAKPYLDISGSRAHAMQMGLPSPLAIGKAKRRSKDGANTPNMPSPKRSAKSAGTRITSCAWPRWNGSTDLNEHFVFRTVQSVLNACPTTWLFGYHDRGRLGFARRVLIGVLQFWIHCADPLFR